MSAGLSLWGLNCAFLFYFSFSSPKPVVTHITNRQVTQLVFAFAILEQRIKKVFDKFIVFYLVIFLGDADANLAVFKTQSVTYLAFYFFHNFLTFPHNSLSQFIPSVRHRFSGSCASHSNSLSKSRLIISCAFLGIFSQLSINHSVVVHTCIVILPIQYLTASIIIQSGIFNLPLAISHLGYCNNRFFFTLHFFLTLGGFVDV